MDRERAIGLRSVSPIGAMLLSAFAPSVDH